MASLSNEQNKIIEDRMIPENHKYSYHFYVPCAINFDSLKQTLETEQECRVFFPMASLNSARPSITLEYAFETKDFDHDKAAKDYPLGKYKPDNFFIPWVDKIKAMENYFGMSDCSFRWGSDTVSAREMTIYLNRSLTKDEIILMKKETEDAVVTTNWGVTPFCYNEKLVYNIQILFDKKLTPDELKDLCSQYSIISYDYDRTPLNIQEIIFFYKHYDNPYKSDTITPDCNVIVREYDQKDFTPFKDALPQSKIISERKLARDEYLSIVKTISNYDFLSISDDLEFGGYEIGMYAYIGIRINGEEYVAGGNYPYSDDIRFVNIFDLFKGLMDIYN